jgi:branched-chain amino acid aminotransferase
MSRTVWHNGEIIPEDSAKLSIYDSSLMFGDMVFEMMRTFNGRTFRLQQHLDRLYDSVKILQIPIHYRKVELYDAHEELTAWHMMEFPEEKEWRTLINVSRGILPMYQEMLGDMGNPNVMIGCFPLRNVLKGMSWVYTKGIEMLVPSQRAIPEYLLDPKIKSRCRQHYKMADQEVKPYWALLLDPDGFISEGTGSNFFMVKDNKLYTPEGRNCLRGISRKYIIDKCDIVGIDLKETNLTLYDALTADEAFLTCTPYSIIPIRSINGHGLSCVGEMTNYLTTKWIKDVNCDFILQARGWDNV